MDSDKKERSDLGNDKNLKNAEGNNVTGVRPVTFVETTTER
jgi:hypothetical protein